MSRFVDRGAITAAWVGVGMAVTIGVSFLLVIPIEFLVTPFALFAGLLIGYYANARSNRAGGPWPRILLNALLAGIATGVTFALLLLLVKVIFFFADTGYPDFNRADADGNRIPPYCQSGADCVYQRYLAIGRGPAFEAAGVTDVDSFTQLYWREQVASAGALIVLSVGGALGGGLMYGLANRRKPASVAVAVAAPAEAAHAKAAMPRTATENLAQLRRHGFFADTVGVPDNDLLPELRERIRKQDDLEFDDAQLAGWALLLADRDRVLYDDTEVVVPGSNAYAEWINDLARISRGAFDPQDLTERWASEDGGAVEISFRFAGTERTLHPVVRDDWLDLAVLADINAMLPSDGARFELPEFGLGQDYLVLALTPAERQALSADLGWTFQLQAARVA